MKLALNSRNALVLAILAIVAVAVAVWIVAIGPKRDEASKLEAQASQVKGSLAQHEAEVATGEESRNHFAAEYQRLVVLGKAVPNDDDTASLLVQVNHIAMRAHVRFATLALSSEEGGEAAESAPPSEGSSSESASPTEVAASTMPLGATIGPAGLAIMPYSLTFSGSFFHIADFIKGLDELVETQKEQVSVDGRLLTINGFRLQGSKKPGFPKLEATFSITTYLTPPGEGLTGGASPESPEGAEALPAAATTGGLPR